MNYYYSKDGQTLGPLSVEELIKVIDRNTLVWNADGSMQNWQAANSVSELSAYFNIPPPPPTANETAKTTIPPPPLTTNETAKTTIQAPPQKGSSKVLFLLVIIGIGIASYFFYNKSHHVQYDDDGEAYYNCTNCGKSFSKRGCTWGYFDSQNSCGCGNSIGGGDVMSNHYCSKKCCIQAHDGAKVIE
ncbi:MAG: DUF4339 domain-containing protein [Bacteroidetes bacterium]|nr:DUF4339 domain-containing protein [Bacteroidota bacterium]